MSQGGRCGLEIVPCVAVLVREKGVWCAQSCNNKRYFHTDKRVRSRYISVESPYKFYCCLLRYKSLRKRNWNWSIFHRSRSHCRSDLKRSSWTTERETNDFGTVRTGVQTRGQLFVTRSLLRQRNGIGSAVQVRELRRDTWSISIFRGIGFFGV